MAIEDPKRGLARVASGRRMMVFALGRVVACKSIADGMAERTLRLLHSSERNVSFALHEILFVRSVVLGSMQSYLRPTDAEAPSGHTQAGLRPGMCRSSTEPV